MTLSRSQHRNSELEKQIDDQKGQPHLQLTRELINDQDMEIVMYYTMQNIKVIGTLFDLVIKREDKNSV